MKRLNATLIAISPEKSDNTLSIIEKLNLAFPVLTDVKGEVMKDYKITFEIPDPLRVQYLKHLNRDFDLVNTGSGWVLPVPATFIIDHKDVIRHRYVNADFTKRMEPTEILDTLESLS